MARMSGKTFLLAVLALACAQRAVSTIGLLDSALQAQAQLDSSILGSVSGQGSSSSGQSSQTSLIGYGQGSSVVPTTPSTPTVPTPVVPTTPSTPMVPTPVVPTTPSTPSTPVGTVTSVSGGQPTAVNGQYTPGGKGDPILTGFDLRPFEFMGRPGAYYNLVSEQHHQVTTKLKVGVMWDHNGTYMEGFGFQYRDQKVTIEIDESDELAVTLNENKLEMAEAEADLEVIPYVERGELLLLWQLHREGLGNTVELTTDLLQITVWLTPAGTVDDGGVKQPAYINFDVSLLSPPAGNEMQGIIGETYNRMLAGEAILAPEHALYLPDDYQFHGVGNEEHYEIDGYFGEHMYNMFGQERSNRQLIEAEELANALPAQRFPLKATGGAPWIKAEVAARLADAKHASGGRKGRFL